MKKDERKDFLGHEGDNRLSDDQIHTDDIRTCQICGSTLSPDEVGNICRDCSDARLRKNPPKKIVDGDTGKVYRPGDILPKDVEQSMPKNVMEKFQKPQDDAYIDKVMQEEKRQSERTIPNMPTKRQTQSSGGGTSQTQTQSQAQTVYVNPSQPTRTTKTTSDKTKPNKTRTTRSMTTKKNVTRIPISDHVEKILFYRKGKRYIRYRDTRTNKFIKKPKNIKE